MFQDSKHGHPTRADAKAMNNVHQRNAVEDTMLVKQKTWMQTDTYQKICQLNNEQKKMKMRLHRMHAQRQISHEKVHDEMQMIKRQRESREARREELAKKRNIMAPPKIMIQRPREWSYRKSQSVDETRSDYGYAESVASDISGISGLTLPCNENDIDALKIPEAPFVNNFMKAKSFDDLMEIGDFIVSKHQISEQTELCTSLTELNLKGKLTGSTSDPELTVVKKASPVHAEVVQDTNNNEDECDEASEPIVDGPQKYKQRKKNAICEIPKLKLDGYVCDLDMEDELFADLPYPMKSPPSPDELFRPISPLYGGIESPGSSGKLPPLSPGLSPLVSPRASPIPFARSRSISVEGSSARSLSPRPISPRHLSPVPKAKISVDGFSPRGSPTRLSRSVSMVETSEKLYSDYSTSPPRQLVRHDSEGSRSPLRNPSPRKKSSLDKMMDALQRPIKDNIDPLYEKGGDTEEYDKKLDFLKTALTNTKQVVKPLPLQKKVSAKGTSFDTPHKENSSENINSKGGKSTVRQSVKDCLDVDDFSQSFPMRGRSSTFSGQISDSIKLPVIPERSKTPTPK